MVTKRALPFVRLKSAELPVPGHDPWCVELKDPAMSVMTDFHERAAVTIPEGAPVDKALDHMKHTGVRAAFVVDESRNKVVGMITAYDIMGEKPFRYLESVGGRDSAASRDDVQVRDIMERVDEWPVISMAEVEGATVAMVLATFNDSGRTHIAVVESSREFGERLRGLFSSARIKRLVER